MAFSTLSFIFVFLPLALLVYYLTPKRFRNITLLIENILFYAWGSPKYVLILIATILINYIGGILIEKVQTVKAKKLLLGLSIVIDLLMLGYFKYFNFLVENINSYFHAHISLLHIVMPIGISFYTFMAISYLFDVYREDVKSEKNLLNFSVFLSMFTNIMAGPINRYCTFYEQITKRNENIKDFIYGLKRFIIGLAKKTIIADSMAILANDIFNTGTNEYTILICWLGIIAYTLQLYFDFSGYSDMAIGTGRMFGFKIMENFNFPYISRTFTEFWRRWHISLSSWFKYYLYIPLGGNRKGNFRTYINLFIVFLVTGFWHGASWVFIFWGLWHGFFMIVERFFNLAKREINSKFINGLMHLYCMLFVMLGWVFFRSETLNGAIKYIVSMFDISTLSLSIERLAEYIAPHTIIIMLLAIVASTGVFKTIIEWGDENWIKQSILNAYLVFILFLSWCFLAASTYTPFVYFQF